MGGFAYLTFLHMLILFQRQNPTYTDIRLLPVQNPDTRSDNQVPVSTHLMADLNVSLDPLTTSVVRHFMGSADRTLEESLDDAYSDGNALVFKHICELLEIDVEHIDLKARRTAKKLLFDAIVTAVSFPSMM